MEQLTIDLLAPEGNVHAMIAKAYRVLSLRQASELLQSIYLDFSPFSRSINVVAI
jgi:hypothetical protein